MSSPLADLSPAVPVSAPITLAAAEEWLGTHAGTFERAGVRPRIVGSVSSVGESGHDLDILLTWSPPLELEEQLGVFYAVLAPGLDIRPNPSPCESAGHPDHWFVGCIAPNGWLVEFYFRDPAGDSS